MSHYRVLVTGSRDWTDARCVETAMDLIECEYASTHPITLVSGACPTGADRIAEDYAAHLAWDIERHPANWEVYGKSAGFRRNAAMVALGADICLAFIKDRSRGATHTADLAVRAGVPVVRTSIGDAS